MDTSDPVARARARLALAEEDAEYFFDGVSIAGTGYLAPVDVNRRLALAEEKILTGDKAEARHILIETYLYAVKNPRFWWNVARAARTRPQAIRALLRVIQLRPRHYRAWNALRKLDSEQANRLYVELKTKPRKKRKKR